MIKVQCLSELRAYLIIYYLTTLKMNNVIGLGNKLNVSSIYFLRKLQSSDTKKVTEEDRALTNN